MARLYSMDLRLRVVREAVAEVPTREVAAQFKVSPSFVSKLHSRFRRTGSVAADKQGGDKRSHRIEAHGGWLLGQVAETPDLTLAELRAGLAGRGLEVSGSTIWRFFERHGLSVKKSLPMPPSKTAPMSP